MNPNYPIYIVSKHRADLSYTTRFLSEIKIPHFIVVEAFERDLYEVNTQDNPYVTLLTLDPYFLDSYKTLDQLGNSKSKGPGAARNFAWQHAKDTGYDYHWVMDDNIRDFYRFHKNKKYRVNDGTIFYCMEDFCEQYENVYMAGPQYELFVPAREKIPSLQFNTRIYSCNLIRNDIPYHWRGRYNEDTILSLDILHDGFCTVLFNAFLQGKIATQKISGGNNKDFYQNEGTLPKTEMLVRIYPQYAKPVWRFHRIHHYINYKVFSQNKLRRKADQPIRHNNDQYDMKLIRIAS